MVNYKFCNQEDVLNISPTLADLWCEFIDYENMDPDQIDVTLRKEVIAAYRGYDWSISVVHKASRFNAKIYSQILDWINSFLPEDEALILYDQCYVSPKCLYFKFRDMT